MAYASSKTYTEGLLGGRKCLLVVVSETECSGTDEYNFSVQDYLRSGLWRLVRIKVVKTAGSASTVAPVFGTATNPTSGTAAYVGGLVVAASQDSTNSNYGWAGDGMTYYGRSVPDSAADNSITTKLYFVEGWQ